jgi:hypothetical protein
LTPSREAGIPKSARLPSAKTNITNGERAVANVATNCAGQLTVIAEKRGPVWIGYTPNGVELDIRDRLSLECMPKALVYGCKEVSRGSVIDIIFELAEGGFWREGYMFDRKALKVLRKSGVLLA